MLGKSLIRTMATFFLRIRSRFSYKLNKISWELPFLGKLFSSLFVSQAVSIKILAKNDILNLKSVVFVILGNFVSRNIYFDEKLPKIDNFIEYWSQKVPKTDNFMRPAPNAITSWRPNRLCVCVCPKGFM